MTMTMTMTHSDKVHQHQSAAWPNGHEGRGHNPAKKSVETVVPRALGKVCNADTVVDSVQSQKKKERRRHKLLLR